MLAVRATYGRMLERLPAVLEIPGRKLLGKISSPGWTLECYLPLWLAHTSGLPSSVARSLALANVYGLSSILLQDDLDDGDVGLADRNTAMHLAMLFYHQALRQYLHLFVSDSPFWLSLDEFILRWQRAATTSNLPLSRSFESLTDADFLALAERGAPLKICCVAASLLAQREEYIPALTAIVDDLMVGSILVDHACDWREDLAAGRHNLFVAYASPRMQSPELRELNRRAVLEEFYLGRGGRPYFKVAQAYARRATEGAGKAGYPVLTDYCRGFEAQIATLSQHLVHTATMMFRTVETLLGSAFPTDRSPVTR